MKFSAVLSMTMALLQSCTWQPAKPPLGGELPAYIITISKQNIRSIRVDAAIPLRTDTLWMSPVAIAPLPDGYGTFVHNLKAADAQGNLINLKPLGKGMWKVDAPVGSFIQLSYEVLMEHDTVEWSVSAAFARAYALGDVLFFVGRTVFIASKGIDSSKIQVRFVMPSGWKLATAYREVDSTSGTYQADDLSELWDNGNFAGNIRKEEIAVGKLRVTMAATLSMGNGFSLVGNLIARVVNAYTTDMGGAPEGRLVVMGSVASLIQGGETFKNSISLLFNQPPETSNKEQWAEMLSHEIFHLWNGQTIVSESQSQVEWFAEGFTNYLSLLSIFKTGFLTRAEYLQQIAAFCNDYLRLVGRISMVEAGADKGSNYGMIYSGGASVAMALDILCRQKTKNKYGVSKILEKMYSDFGVSHKRYRYVDVVRATSAVAGIDMSGFFEDYVAGLKVLPVGQLLGFAGLLLKGRDGDASIEPDPAASGPEKELLGAILSH